MKIKEIKTFTGVLLTIITILMVTSCYFNPVQESFPQLMEFSVKDINFDFTDQSRVTVTGADFPPVVKYFSKGTDTVELEVPEGKDRTVNLHLQGISASLEGEKTVDISAGENKEIFINTALSDTKIIIPDPTSDPVGRLVQIDGMSGSGEKILTGADIGFVSDFYPTDVDFDNQGRIYVAVNTAYEGSGSYGNGMIIRIDDIEAGEYEETYYNPLAGNAIMAITVDRERDILYFFDQSLYQLFSIDISVEPASAVSYSLDMELGDEVTGISFVSTEEGDYIFLTAYNIITKIDVTDPENPAYTTADDVYTNYFDSFGNLDFYDVTARGGYLYISAVSDYSYYDSKIIRMDIAGYPPAAEPPSFGVRGEKEIPDIGELYFPHRFVATFKKEKIFVLDGGGSLQGSPEPANLLSFNFDGSSVSGWETYSDTDFGFLGYYLSC